MQRIILFTLLAMAVFTQENEQPIVENDPYRVDLRIEHLNTLYQNMAPSEMKKIELADESYFTLSMPDTNKLLVVVMLYNPADEKHYKAYEAEYLWNEDLGTLIAEKCEHLTPEILPPSVEPVCEEGIMHASELISLEVSGIADYEGWDMENLEKCIADKLPPKVVEKPYLKCFVNVIGDAKYAQEAIDAKIASMEKQGYECQPNGDCVKAEDPEIFAKIVEELKGEKTAIAVPNDDRPRYCEIEPIMVIGTDPNVAEPEYMESHEYSCSYWVNHIYCKNVNDKLQWAVEYIDNNGHRETFHTYPFNVVEADKTISIPWAQGIRMNQMDLFMAPGSLAVEEMEFKFNKTKLPVSCKSVNAPSRSSMYHVKAPLSGELSGFHFARLPEGVRVKSVIHRN